MKKNNQKKTILLLFSLLFLTISPTSAFAEDEQKPEKLSEEKRGLISQNCGTIRQSLKNLQRNDSRARTYFGAIYETISSDYITPMNLRLIKNDISSASLINIQSEIASAREDFSTDFINYSKNLEELISYDCRLDPDGFYEKLEKTRKKREKVSEDMKSINKFLTESYKSVETLKEKFNEQ